MILFFDLDKSISRVSTPRPILNPIKFLKMTFVYFISVPLYDVVFRIIEIKIQREFPSGVLL
jgi:hypothetical protein